MYWPATFTQFSRFLWLPSCADWLQMHLPMSVWWYALFKLNGQFQGLTCFFGAVAEQCRSKRECILWSDHAFSKEDKSQEGWTSRFWIGGSAAWFSGGLCNVASIVGCFANWHRYWMMQSLHHIIFINKIVHLLVFRHIQPTSSRLSCPATSCSKLWDFSSYLFIFGFSSK